jgi:hypothetical protein
MQTHHVRIDSFLYKEEVIHNKGNTSPSGVLCKYKIAIKKIGQPLSTIPSNDECIHLSEWITEISHS